MPDPDLDALDPLILPDALLKLITADGASRAELHVVGNNAGIVSLANVLRWLAAAERETLHLRSETHEAHPSSQTLFQTGRCPAAVADRL